MNLDVGSGYVKNPLGCIQITSFVKPVRFLGANVEIL